MTETKFTPGPWSFRQNRNCSLDFFGEGGHRLILGNTFLINQDANAHLIAAARELYEALVRMKEWCEDEVGAELPCDSINAALAKARGEV